MTRTYEFRVAQRLSATAVACFPELTVRDGSTSPVLSGPVRDDAELHGIFSRLQLLGLTILDVHRLPDRPCGASTSPSSTDAGSASERNEP
jgi:hypothetical protein